MERNVLRALAVVLGIFAVAIAVIYYRSAKDDAKRLFVSRYKNKTPKEIDRAATKMALIPMTISALIMAFTLMVWNGDMYCMLIGLMVAALGNFNALIGSIHRSDIERLDQAKDFLRRCIEQYEKTGNVEEMLERALGEENYDFRRDLENLLAAVESDNALERTEQYAQKETPERMFGMLAMLCAEIKERGDMTMPDGKSAFVKKLEYLEAEADKYRNAGAGARLRYLWLSVVPLVPLFAVKAIDVIAVKVNGTPVFVNNAFGDLIMMVAMVMCMAGYYTLIARIYRPKTKRNVAKETAKADA